MKTILIAIPLLFSSCKAFDAIASDEERSAATAEQTGEAVEGVSDALGLPGAIGLTLGSLVTLATQQGLAWRRKRLETKKAA